MTGRQKDVFFVEDSSKEISAILILSLFSVHPFRPSDIVNLTVSSLNAYRFSELLIKFDSFIVLHRLTTFMYIFLDLKTGWKIAR